MNFPIWLKEALIKAGIVVVAYLSPIKAALIAAMAIVAIDLISGILAAKKQGQPITSTGLKRTIIKIFVYEAAIVLGYLMQQYLIGSFLPVTQLITGYIGVTELKSVLENIEIVTGIPVLQSIIDKLAPPQ